MYDSGPWSRIIRPQDAAKACGCTDWRSRRQLRWDLAVACQRLAASAVDIDAVPAEQC